MLTYVLGSVLVQAHHMAHFFQESPQKPTGPKWLITLSSSSPSHTWKERHTQVQFPPHPRLLHLKTSGISVEEK